MFKDDKLIKKFYKELQKRSNDEEAIDDLLNKVMNKAVSSDATAISKAGNTDVVMHQLLGEAALDEIEGLQNLPLKEAAKKVKEVSNKGRSELEKSLHILPEIKVQDLTSEKAYGVYSPRRGIVLDSSFENAEPFRKQLALGTTLHEGGHALDDVARRLSILEDEMLKRSSPEYKKERFRKLNDKSYKPSYLEMMNDDELNRYYSQIKEPYKNFIKSNPGKLESMVGDAGVTKFESQDVPEILPKEFQKMSPTKLQNLYSGSGHWFKRNFPYENLKKVLKGGLKTVKGISPVLAKAGIPLAGLYSGYSEAKEEGMSDLPAMAYAAAEELNPIPVSGLDYYKGMEESAKGRASNIEKNYMPEEKKIESKALEDYQKSPAAKHRAFNKLKKLLEE